VDQVISADAKLELTTSVQQEHQESREYQETLDYLDWTVSTEFQEKIQKTLHQKFKMFQHASTAQLDLLAHLDLLVESDLVDWKELMDNLAYLDAMVNQDNQENKARQVPSAEKDHKVIPAKRDWTAENQLGDQDQRDNVELVEHPAHRVTLAKMAESARKGLRAVLAQSESQVLLEFLDQREKRVALDAQEEMPHTAHALLNLVGHLRELMEVAVQAVLAVVIAVADFKQLNKEWWIV